MVISLIEMRGTSRMREEEELGEKKIDRVLLYMKQHGVFGLQQLIKLHNRIKPLDLPK